MSQRSEIRATVASAPEFFTSRGVGTAGITGKVTVILKGMAVLDTRIGEIIVRISESDGLVAGQEVFLHPDYDGKTVRINTEKNSRTKKPGGMTHDTVAPITAGSYRSNPTPDLVTSHAAAAEASVEALIHGHQPEDAFGLARALSLIPSTDTFRSAIDLLTHLFVSLARGDEATWMGASRSLESSSWNGILKQASIEIPGMGFWHVRQFPVQTHLGTLWGLLALPDDADARVSRFMIELPSPGLGLVQIKGFGSGATFELVVNTTVQADAALTETIREAVAAVALESGSDFKLSITNEPDRFANMGQARRTRVGA